MEARAGDSPPKGPVSLEEKPKDRRIPLSVVVFNTVTAVPTLGSMTTEVRVGDFRTVNGVQTPCPQPFLDPAQRTIWIAGREYPLERVHYWERAKMASSKASEPPPLPDYTLGRKRKLDGSR
jgi:hypothetical protein